MTDRLTPEREAATTADRRADLLLMLLHGGAATNSIAAHVVDALIEAVRAESAAENTRLERKVAGLTAEQERDDAEYAKAIRERDRARSALREAADQVAELESHHAEAVVVSEALHRRLSAAMLAGSALHAALTMPTTPEQRQAALDQFTAVARQATGAVAR